MNRLRFSLASIALLFLASGCLDSAGPGQAVPIEETTFASALGVNLAQSTKTSNGVYYRDITVGTGAAVVNGNFIDVGYTGWLSSGFQFETNVYSFTLGTGNAIAGWHDGIQGMRVGGVRQIIIPPHMAYGASGSGPIPGNAVIVFRVEILGAR
jgi:FKBP-type peptidyl-prolyl cis-trans isomerase